jgi:hypothetical protein
MAKTTAAAKPTTKKAKISKTASVSLVEAVTSVLDKAMTAAAPSQLTAMSEDKLFEVLTMARLLRAFKRLNSGSKVVHVPRQGGKASEIIVALNPASANRKKFSHFDLVDASATTVGEAWVSLEVQALSWHMSGGASKLPPAALHELDVAIVFPSSGLYPVHTQVQVAITCKNVRSATKEQVREALGLRRETALLREPAWSSAPWLVASVPADPPSPLLLVSSDPGVKKYRTPVDHLGVYVRYLHFDT